MTRPDVIAALALALAASAAPASGTQPPAPGVVDGDTIDLAGERIRLIGLDAPELRAARCDAERRLGVIAGRRLAELLAHGPAEIERKGRDRYGRTLAVVRAGGKDLAAEMIAGLYARPWRGRREPWCR